MVAARGWAPPIPPSPPERMSRPDRSSVPKWVRPAWAKVSKVPWRIPWVPM